MQRKKVPAGHHRFGLARLVLVLALLFFVVALTAGLAGCLFQPVLTARGTLLFLPVWGDRIFEKCGIGRDEGGDGGKTLEIRGKRRLSARDGGANYQQS